MSRLLRTMVGALSVLTLCVFGFGYSGAAQTDVEELLDKAVRPGNRYCLVPNEDLKASLYAEEGGGSIKNEPSLSGTVGGRVAQVLSIIQPGGLDRRLAELRVDGTETVVYMDLTDPARFSRSVIPNSAWQEALRMVGKPVWLSVSNPMRHRLPCVKNLTKYYVCGVEPGDVGCLSNVRMDESTLGPLKYLLKTVDGRRGCYYGGTLQFQSEWHTENPRNWYSLSNEAWSKIEQEQVYIGMNRELAELSWGSPEKINRTRTSYGSDEQWVFGLGRYLYFEDDRLVAVQR